MVPFIPQIIFIQHKILFRCCADRIVIVISFIDKRDDISRCPVFFLLVAHRDGFHRYFYCDISSRKIDLFSACRDNRALSALSGALVQLCQITLVLTAGKCRPALFCYDTVIDVHQDSCRHHMNIIRLYLHADLLTRLSAARRLDHDLIVAAERCDLIVHAFEHSGIHNAVYLTFPGFCDDNVFRPYHHIHTGVFRHVVHAGELRLTELDSHRCRHPALKDIALTDKVSDKRIFRLIVYLLRGACLLDNTIRHYYDFVRHCERFFLVVRHIDKCDAKLFMHGFKLELHLFAHL